MIENFKSVVLTSVLLLAVLLPLNFFLRETIDPTVQTVPQGGSRTTFDLDRDGASDLLTYNPNSSQPRWRSYLLSGVEGGTHKPTNTQGVTAVWELGERSGIPVSGDYNGDGFTDLGLYYAGKDRTWSNTKHNWTIFLAEPTARLEDRFLPGYQKKIERLWGFGTGLPVVSDYDGDGVTDIGIYFPPDSPLTANQWHLLFSRGGFRSAKAQVQQNGFGEIIIWGPDKKKMRAETNIIPVSADYNGDGISELALWASNEGGDGGKLEEVANWYLYILPKPGEKSGQRKVIPFGRPGDIPVPADYNCDGKTDIAVYSPTQGKWLLRFGKNDENEINWKIANGVPLVADFDGDGCADPAFYTDKGEHRFHILNSSISKTARKVFGERSPAITQIKWELAGDIPVQIYLRDFYLRPRS